MALIKTNEIASLNTHLNPAQVPLLIPLDGDGAGISDVIEIGRYNDIALFITGDTNYDAILTMFNFMACDTADGTFVPIKFGGSSNASPALVLNVREADVGTNGVLMLLGNDEFGGGGSDASSMRGFTFPFLRIDVVAADLENDDLPVTVLLKMY